jgi:lipopolysaccharide export LptBFGC system permease protein LptF
MRLLDRYLLRELLTWLGFCLVGLIVFCIAFDLISGLNRIQEHQLLPGDVLELYLVKLPGLLVFILPITLLLSLLCALTNHTRHHEITAMRAAGVGLWRLCMPYMVVGFLLSLIVLALNETFVPDSEAKMAQIMDRRMRQNAARPDAAVQPTLGFPNSRDHRTWVWDSFNSKTGVMTNPKVDWVENGAQWTLFARYAEQVNGIWTFYGGLYFSTNDLINLDSLAARLKHPTNILSQFVADQLSSNTQTLLARCTIGTNCIVATNVELRRALVNDLNHVIREGPLYQPARFDGVKLPPQVLESAEYNRRSADLMMFNRALLTEAWPQEFSRNSMNAVVVSKAGSFPRYTNVMAMPQFTETPHDFAIEAKFNQRFQALAAESAGVPIIEIVDYLKLHPNLGQKNKRWLLTQLHGRIASPWSCLVVVFIAIPFGAASGRRNIFAGVAGSIVVCFAYFILLKVGLWLGTGGVLPPWMAAWLPNAVFGITGFWMMLRVR